MVGAKGNRGEGQNVTERTPVVLPISRDGWYSKWYYVISSPIDVSPKEKSRMSLADASPYDPYWGGEKFTIFTYQTSFKHFCSIGMGEVGLGRDSRGQGPDIRI